MTGFESNLLAGVIILVVDLAFTYLIVDQLLRRREDRQWKPARVNLLNLLWKECTMRMMAWAANCDPPLVQMPISYTMVDSLPLIPEQFRQEVEDFRRSPNPVASRPDEYWRKQLKGLSSGQESMRAVIDQSHFALSTEPELVAALADFSSSYYSAPSIFRGAHVEIHEQMTDEDLLQAVFARGFTLQCFDKLLTLWDVLQASSAKQRDAKFGSHSRVASP